MGIIEKIFGTHSHNELKRIYPIVDRIEALAPAMEALSDEELKGKTKEFKDRLNEGETLDDILPEAYAVVREAAWRSTFFHRIKYRIIIRRFCICVNTCRNNGIFIIFYDLRDHPSHFSVASMHHYFNHFIFLLPVSFHVSKTIVHYKFFSCGSLLNQKRIFLYSKKDITFEFASQHMISFSQSFS